MALTVETGAVVAGADCYEDAAATVARLDLLGLTTLGTKLISERESTIRLSTIDCEDELRPGIEGSRVSDTQPRLYPLHDSMDTTGLQFDFDEIPEAIKLGIAFRCEDRVAGRVSSAAEVIEEEDERGKIKYRENSGGSRFDRTSRESWKAMKPLFWTG